MKIKKVVFVFIFLGAGVASAQDSVPKEVSENIEVIAKKRLYLGGVDEQPLQVQEQLIYPVRAVNLLAVQKEVLDQ